MVPMAELDMRGVPGQGKEGCFLQLLRELDLTAASHEAGLPVTSQFLMDPIVFGGDLAHQLNGTSFCLNYTNILA